MKKIHFIKNILISILIGTPVFAHDPFEFEYFCSVTRANEQGQFFNVINVVFMPYGKNYSVLYEDMDHELIFEVEEVKDSSGNFLNKDLTISLLKRGSKEYLFQSRTSEFGKTSLNSKLYNLGATCFHKTAR